MRAVILWAPTHLNFSQLRRSRRPYRDPAVKAEPVSRLARQRRCCTRYNPPSGPRIRAFPRATVIPARMRHPTSRIRHAGRHHGVARAAKATSSYNSHFHCQVRHLVTTRAQWPPRSSRDRVGKVETRWPVSPMNYVVAVANTWALRSVFDSTSASAEPVCTGASFIFLLVKRSRRPFSSHPARRPGQLSDRQRSDVAHPAVESTVRVVSRAHLVQACHVRFGDESSRTPAQVLVGERDTGRQVRHRRHVGSGPVAI